MSFWRKAAWVIGGTLEDVQREKAEKKHEKYKKQTANRINVGDRIHRTVFNQISHEDMHVSGVVTWMSEPGYQQQLAYKSDINGLISPWELASRWNKCKCKN